MTKNSSSWYRILCAAALVAAAAAPGAAGAAVARLDAGTQVGTTQTTATSVSGTKTIGAGSNRLLLVTVYVQKSASDATFSVTTATFGGQALTQAVITPSTTSSRDKIYIGYLREAGIVAAGANNTINITISAGTTSGWSVFAQTYQGVDQTTPITATAHNFSETNTNTSASFGAATAVNAGGYSYYALAFNSASGTRTLPASYVQNWTRTTTSPSAFGDDKAVATTGTENPTITYAAGQRYVLGAVTLNPAPAGNTLTAGNGTDPTGNLTAGTNAPVDQFTLQMSPAGVATVTAVTVGITAGNTAITGLELHSGTSCATGLLGTALAGPFGTSATLSGFSIQATTTASTYTLCATPGAVAAATNFSANVSGVTQTGAGAFTDSDTANTLSVQPSTVTLGTGALDPAVNTSLVQGTTGLLDSFTFQASYATTTIPRVTLALTGNTLLSSVTITSSSTCSGGTTYGTQASPTASQVVTLTTPLTASGTTQEAYLCGTATAAANGLVSGRIASLALATYAAAGSDTSNTLRAGPSVAPALTVGNGTDPTPSAWVAGVTTAVDQFTLATASGTSTVSAVNVALTGNTAVSQIELRSGAGCGGTLLGTVVTPGTTASFGGLTQTITGVAATYTICATAGTVATPTSFSVNVTGLTYSGTFNVVDNDTGPTFSVSASTVTLATGALDPAANSSVAQGSTARLDSFTLQSSFGTATIGTVTLTITGNTLLSNVSIQSTSACSGGTTYGSQANPAASQAITVTGLTATTTATQFYVCGTATATASGTLSALVGSFTAASYAPTGTDTANTLRAGPATGTIAGTATADTAPGLCNAIAVTAPYTGDSNGNNTLSYRYRTPTGTGAWIGPTSRPHSASPYSFNITGLTQGSSYDVEVTYVDADGVTGTAVQTVSNVVVGASCATTPGALTGTAPACNQVNLSAAYTGDSNGNNTVTFTRGTDGVTFGTTVCSLVSGGANPRTCADGGVTASTTFYYRATFADADGVVGQATSDSGAVAVPVCAATIAVTGGTMPAAANAAAGSSGNIVGRILLTASGGTVTLNGLSISSTGTAVAGSDVATLALFNDGTGAYVGAGAWNATTSHYDFTSIGLAVAAGAPVTLRVVLGLAAGATVGRTFTMNMTVPADVVVPPPYTVGNAVTIAGNALTVTAGTPGGSTLVDAPMVQILNPQRGSVVSPGGASNGYKVQIRVFNRERNRGVDGVTAVTLSTDNGSTFPVTATRNTRYDTIDPGFTPTVTGATYEATVAGPAAGSYTLRARAVNNAPTARTTTSEPVQIVVASATRKGDGNLLVRDNSSQLCNDCHAVKTHSSENMGSTYGAWSTQCRDCHSPHGTRNIFLISESILPPSVAGTVLPAARVATVTKTGAIAGNGWDTVNNRPAATSSFVNQGDNSGVCQVCHTRTQGPGGVPRFRRTGNTDTHYVASATAPCMDCHSHTAGFAPSSCLGCHGTTAADFDDLGASFWNNGSRAQFNTTQWAYSGHGKTTGTYDVTANPAANLPTTPSPGTSECLYCHDDAVSHGTATNPFRLRGAANGSGVTAAFSTTNPNEVCLNCHDSLAQTGVTPAGQSNKKGTRFADATHNGAKHTDPTLGGKFCWDCHEPHGDRASNNTNPGENIAMIRSNVFAITDGVYGYLGTAGQTRAVTYNVQTASPPAQGKAVETTTPAGTQHIGLCQACHAATTDTLVAPTAWTKYWNRLGYDDTDGPGGAAPAASAHNSGSTTTPYCISCHKHAAQFKGSGACTDCHAGAQTITVGPATGQTRRAIDPEFALSWSHKRSASPAGSVNQWDCIVCHMEGDPSTGDPSSLHADGFVNLRDPDTGNQIAQVTFGGTGAGAYTTPDPNLAASFATFSRNLSSASIEPAVAAVMINMCLKCHDANGAQSPNAQTPGARANRGANAPAYPFDAQIASTLYVGTGVTALGLQGAVTNIDASFATTNSSYHPVKGKNNNSYASGTRMFAPWNAITRTAGSTSSWGYLISCWDCHAKPTDVGIITDTVTAHGGPVTLRGNATGSGTAPNATTGATLCWKCHQGYNGASPTHGAGSAMNTGADSGMTPFMQYGCNRCHGSDYTTLVRRPIRAIDVHGVDVLPATGGTKTGRWAGTATGTPAQVNAKPYAFIRNTRSLSNHMPARIGGSTYTPTCVHIGDSPCSNRTETYTPGGAF